MSYQYVDFPALLPNALGTAITNAYNINTVSEGTVGGTAVTTPFVISPETARQVSCFLSATTVGASAIANLTFKIEVSYDDAIWFPIQSRDHTTDAGLTTKKEHTLALGAAPQVNKPFLITCDQMKGAKFIRFGVKGDAGGSAGDAITLNVMLA